MKISLAHPSQLGSDDMTTFQLTRKAEVMVGRGLAPAAHQHRQRPVVHLGARDFGALH